MGENSDHAPDELIDLYWDMGYLDSAERLAEGGVTPEELLARLQRFREKAGL
jgi:hypothetical protein